MKKKLIIPVPQKKVFAAIPIVAKELGGKLLKQNEEQGLVSVQMDKKLQGKVLGDRSQLDFTLKDTPEQGTEVSVLAFPLNAVGQKLLFGARKGVVDTVLEVFFKTLEAKVK